MFHQREELLEHVGYEEEARLYFAVATGDISLVKEYAQNYMKPDASGNEKNGILSRDPLQNTKDHFVIFTALITRLCVEYGMIREEAYTISDLYINKMDVCNNSQKILYLQREMLLDFTTRMAASLSDLYKACTRFPGNPIVNFFAHEEKPTLPGWLLFEEFSYENVY